MSSFDDRKRGEEARYAHDQETQFKIMARRNKLLGLWAAELMNIQGDEAQAYAKSVILADLEEVGDEDVFRKVRGDFDKYGVSLPEAKLREEMSRLIAVARDQVLKEQE